MRDDAPLPAILWVAANPPLPPFSGGMLKAQCALTALAPLTPVDLVAFAPRGECADLHARWRAFWRDVPITLHVLEEGERLTPLQALRARRFQSGATFERSALADLLRRLDWDSHERLVVFDDILFAPLCPDYGSNAILSPHDCISEMSKSHSQQAASRGAALKFWLQYRIARHYEQSFYHQALLTHLVTQRDRCLLERINAGAHYHVVPFRDQNVLFPTEQGAGEYDVLVWADLRISATVSGVRAFLKALSRDAAWLRSHRIVVVGKVAEPEARRLLAGDLPDSVSYSDWLEDDRGEVRQAKITVIPDLGGAGIKSRCLSVLLARRCLACLYVQMEGLQAVCDVGALNAATMDGLAVRVRAALADGSYTRIAASGGEWFARDFGPERLQRMWVEMIQRAVAIRGCRVAPNPA